MVIHSLVLRNFRSFRDTELRLRPFVLLIGRNAAGKSNLIHGFTFLRDIARSGLANSISRQGGLTYLQNAALACGRNLEVEVELTLPTVESELALPDGRQLGIRPGVCTYSFALACNERPEVRKDRFLMNFTVTAPDGGPVSGSVELVHVGDRVQYVFDLPMGLDPSVFMPPVLREARLRPDTLMLESPTIYPMGLVRRALALVSCYEFGPSLPSRLELRTGAAELAEDGSNTAIALGRVLSQPETRSQFLGILRDLLPFIEDVVVGDRTGRAPEIMVSEIYAPGRYLPADALSSGTIELLALIVALFFSPRELAIFEEPVARLHPLVVGRLVGLMEEASKEQPLLVSTQHPAVLRHVPVEAVCLVSRDTDGFSVITRPAESPDVRTFLEEEVGLDELFLTDLL
ncbi:MAG: AAA family ATPase [Methanospirillum sp.]|nr:AAA family ATPase [Methanospirillum sp.]